MKDGNITPAMYAAAVSCGMTEAEAVEQLDAAEIERTYRQTLNNCRSKTRLTLELALIACLNGCPLPTMSRRAREMFVKYVRPYVATLKQKEQ